MSTQTLSDRSIQLREKTIQWSNDSPLTAEIATRSGTISVQHGRFVGGVSDGIEIIEVNTGAVRAMILPTRGMSIWYLEANRTHIGWESPIHGPVHPSLVPVWDPSGLGWLEGFDELVVRCGLESNGAPQHDAQGRLVYPLHGRIGNLPADSLWLEYDEASGRLDIVGEVLERRLFFKRLRLRSRIRFNAGRPNVELLDDVTNEASTATTIQMLYHINVGEPLLSAGAEVSASVAELAPKDERSANEIDQWNQLDGPQSGYAERVYFGRMRDSEAGDAATMIRTANRGFGLGVSYRTATLPYFVMWKNTAATEDGYVVGLEPATNLPNTKSFEQQQGRVITIEPGETVPFRVGLHPLCDAEAVEQFSERITNMADGEPTVIHRQPQPGWTPGID